MFAILKQEGNPQWPWSSPTFKFEWHKSKFSPKDEELALFTHRATIRVA
jgi:hypothetical protein